jgi:hypothetical protein
MKRLAFAGIGIWLAATVALRTGGQWILEPDRTIAVAVLLAITAPIMLALPRRLFARFAIKPESYAIGAIALVAPGMLLDTISAIAFPQVFPNIRPDAAGLFGGWLLYCNVLALVSAAAAAVSATADRSRGGAASPPREC